MKEKQRKCIKCGGSPFNDPDVTLHRFPKPGTKNSLRCELWAKYCFPQDPWSSVEFQNRLYSKHFMLCSKHFKKTSFIDCRGERLFKFAVPDEECDKRQHSEQQALIENHIVPACSAQITDDVTVSQPSPVQSQPSYVHSHHLKSHIQVGKTLLDQDKKAGFAVVEGKRVEVEITTVISNAVDKLEDFVTATESFALSIQESAEIISNSLDRITSALQHK